MIFNTHLSRMMMMLAAREWERCWTLYKCVCGWMSERENSATNNCCCKAVITLRAITTMHLSTISCANRGYTRISLESLARHHRESKATLQICVSSFDRRFCVADKLTCKLVRIRAYVAFKIKVTLIMSFAKWRELSRLPTSPRTHALTLMQQLEAILCGKVVPCWLPSTGGLANVCGLSIGGELLELFRLRFSIWIPWSVVIQSWKTSRGRRSTPTPYIPLCFVTLLAFAATATALVALPPVWNANIIVCMHVHYYLNLLLTGHTIIEHMWISNCSHVWILFHCKHHLFLSYCAFYLSSGNATLRCWTWM